MHGQQNIKKKSSAVSKIIYSLAWCEVYTFQSRNRVRCLKKKNWLGRSLATAEETNIIKVRFFSTHVYSEVYSSLCSNALVIQKNRNG